MISSADFLSPLMQSAEVETSQFWTRQSADFYKILRCDWSVEFVVVDNRIIIVNNYNYSFTVKGMKCHEDTEINQLTS